MLILSIVQGQDYLINGTLTQTTDASPPVTSPIDLTSCELILSVRTQDGVLVATCDTALSNGTLTITTPTSGLFTIFFASLVTKFWPIDTLNWDLWLLSSGGTIHTPVSSGQIVVALAETKF
jgi:hypothetical protein